MWEKFGERGLFAIKWENMLELEGAPSWVKMTSVFPFDF